LESRAAENVTRELFDKLLNEARKAERDELPRLIGALAEVNAVALARLAAPVATAPPDEWLDIETAAVYLNVRKDFLYRRKHLGKKVGNRLVYSRKTLDRFVEKSR
jgi:hypothetical protein